MKKIPMTAKVIRAATAIVVLGVPLVTGTAALPGYGVCKAYKRVIPILNQLYCYSSEVTIF